MDVLTERPGVVLRSLAAQDAAAFHRLLHISAAHLSRFGDYTTSIDQSVTYWVEEFSASDPRLDFGIYEDGILVGRAALNPVAPPRYGCGYLLAADACGRGLATLALSALVEHARALLDATDVFAGVTRGNSASVAVLRRVGFVHVASFPLYDRYQKSWITPDPSPVVGAT
jgi:RimJ/RimL family protein N-acetyltransferase